MSIHVPSLPLQPRRIAAALAGHAIGCEVQVHEEVTSTSDLVRELGQSGHPHGLAVFAESQTAGRGRRENRWSAPAGQDILCSLLLRPEVRAEHWARLTTLAALAICRAAEVVCGLQPRIKWPNDVHLGERKCAGILAETFIGAQGPFMVLGIGLNVNTTTYPEELRNIATSLRLEMGDGRLVDRNAVAIALLKHLDALAVRWSAGFDEVVVEVRARSRLLGRQVRARVDGREVEGRAVDLNEEGHLVLSLADGSTLALTSAEQVRLTGMDR